MFLPFLYELRRRGVPVGAQEALSLAGALKAGLHDSSLDGFYHVARALLVHAETHLDAFDQAFLAHFKGMEGAGQQLTQELLEWLKEAREKRELTPEERELLERFDAEELEKLFQQRLEEQRERHDGGTKWIGTGGASPFGHSGNPREGFRVGGEGAQGTGGRMAMKLAGARKYQGYRGDVVLDTRQLAVALRKLRAFTREGAPDELDVEGTIASTAKNAGELEVVTRPPRRPNTRVVLMMDVGGSMDPYAHLVSRLFSVAKQATHFKELRTYYFHNCVYGRVFDSPYLVGGISVPELLGQVGRHFKLVVVGDALMAPYELAMRTNSEGRYDPNEGKEGLVWLMELARHFERSAWLNPEPPQTWRGNTIQAVKNVFDMFPLTLEGLGDAVAHLTKGRVVRGRR
ncbi:VWA domain-containing protein [Vitiosangium sp. GDMCC 1.1324]|uniref:vWA domain-containing protein n=1 Tax=Vitiosangium sp. (strain GDMCC 1.1324) TaxID=2138576 RepID=UPI000D3ADFD5|nr:VWA domain-containing protein [Vitiosangium sp. GDMCC 1.1324]PTL79956.1 VWA containing CoxE family protein [Vitiosangium sp. GDMCC 1.1324]